MDIEGVEARFVGTGLLGDLFEFFQTDTQKQRNTDTQKHRNTETQTHKWAFYIRLVPDGIVVN